MKNKGNIHFKAKRKIAGEKARIVGKRKVRDSLIVSLEKAAERWKNEKEKKSPSKIDKLKKVGPGLGLVDIKSEKHRYRKGEQPRNQEEINWVQQKIGDFQEKPRREKKKIMNTASIGAIARKLIAQEKAKIGGKN